MAKEKRGKTTLSPDITTKPYTRPVIVAIVCVSVLVVGMGMWDTSKLPVPAGIVNQLSRLAFQGKLDKVKRLVENNNELDWTALGKQGGLTAIHHALHGRHHSLTKQSLVGKHEVVHYINCGIKL